ncbi:heparinase II/III domain-containing protein [Bordetella genomosp. 2]|uniref:Heparinase II/III-like C-terminal domain-containing protein n=1 Tax=Bordetella genomosp. 2 TaxID=1983456 RepID=A0A261VQF7_9BORD|nr:heparinase II/III family protein [Bordetella genomosp. 2]OZI75712.1 hypothetical protein CAL24_10820 [Bordetella genomosp. 2]
MINEKLAVVRHQAFDNVTLHLPIEWRMDPFQSKSWQHHFMSLRWINPEILGENLLTVLRSFYNFHCVKEINNPYYNNLRGDHTATIRLQQLITFRRYYESKDDVPGVGLCNRLIIRDIANLQSPTMYRAGHNHGLMADIALLDLYEADHRYRPKINKEKILERGINTLKQMFDPTGITREHSVSYQEHNYPLARDFLKHYTSLKGNSAYAPALTSNTRQLLAFALRDCGEYFPLGDSFRQPNNSILSACTEIKESDKVREQIGKEGNRLYCAGGMFFYKRKSTANTNLHFAATCAWNSHNHKQDDELSFCLEINGKMLFDDVGYTVYRNNLDTKLRDADAHNTVTIMGESFCDRTEYAQGSALVEWEETASGFHLLAKHERIKGYEIKRQFRLSNNTLDVEDTIQSSSEKQFTSIHTFILNPKIEPKVTSNFADLICEGRLIARISAPAHQGKWDTAEQIYVGTNRFEYIHTRKLRFLQSGDKTVPFKIEF